MEWPNGASTLGLSVDSNSKTQLILDTLGTQQLSGWIGGIHFSKSTRDDDGKDPPRTRGWGVIIEDGDGDY